MIMPKQSSRKKKDANDIDILAKSIVDEATEELTEKPTKGKNPAAVALGRLGGLKGGKSRAKNFLLRKEKGLLKKLLKQDGLTNLKVLFLRLFSRNMLIKLIL